MDKPVKDAGGSSGEIETTFDMTEHIDRIKAEAEARGMMRAAGIARGFPAISHGHLRVSPADTAMQVSAEIAIAIEQASAAPTENE